MPYHNKFNKDLMHVHIKNLFKKSERNLGVSYFYIQCEVFSLMWCTQALFEASLAP